MTESVKSLSDFIKWADQFKDGQYLFRGVSDVCYPIEASTYRRISKEDRTPHNLLQTNLELIADARLLMQDRKSGRRLTDLELLAELQHLGAATCLIDFTRSALVALWFACRESSSGKGKNGKVVILRSDGVDPLKTVDHGTLEKNLDYFFQLGENLRYPLYQWHPSFQNNRIIAQQSVFVFGFGFEDPPIPEGAQCEVVGCSKQEIRRDLYKLSGITEVSLFPDFEGMARAYAHDKPSLITSNAETYRQRGINMYHKGELDEAIDYLTQTSRLESKDPYAHIHLGQVYHLKGEIKNECHSELDMAITCYTKAIELAPELAILYVYRSRVYYDKSRIGSEKDNKEKQLKRTIKDCKQAIELAPKLADAYNMLGNAYAEQGKFEKAIKNFSKVIDLKPSEPRYYCNRGETFLHLQKWDKARKDLNFAKANRFDISASFQKDYANAEDFEKDVKIKLPKDIKELLDQPRN